MTTAPASPTVVFLHIPKTAGQTIHAELSRIMGEQATSPVRVHTQAAAGQAQFPAGYRLYSGHIDWDALDTLPDPRFVFTVLRDPLERLASFYFFIQRKAQALDETAMKQPENTGMRMARNRSVDDYFFGGDDGWQRFVRDHYYNPYCSYLVTRKIRGGTKAARLPPDVLLRRAARAARGLTAVYSTDRLDQLEQDIKTLLGTDISVTARFINAAPEAADEQRWPRLTGMFERDDTEHKLRDMVLLDRHLMHRLRLAPLPETPL